MKLLSTYFSMVIMQIITPANAEFITITKNNHKYDVSAQFETLADICSTWDQITDYEDLPSFLPNLVTSETLRKSGNKKVVRQVYLVKIFLFLFKLENKFLITEHFSKKKINIQQISGDLMDYSATWKLFKKKEKTVINLSASITPTQFQMILLSKNKIDERFKTMTNALIKRLDSIDKSDGC